MASKRPGTDGLPAEFYKVFWNHVKPFQYLTPSTVAIQMDICQSRREED